MLTTAFQANTEPTETLTEESFLDLVADMYAQVKDSPPTIMVSLDTYQNKLEPWSRRGRAYKVLGIRGNSPKARKITVKPRRFIESRAP